jgi:hypothetical protein
LVLVVIAVSSTEIISPKIWNGAGCSLPLPPLSRRDKLSIVTARSGAAGLGAVVLQALLPAVDLNKFNEKI